MTATQLKDLHDLNGQNDIEMLQALKLCCNEEDLAEVDLLIYLNDTVGIGWGEPSAPHGRARSPSAPELRAARWSAPTGA